MSAPGARASGERSAQRAAGSASLTDRAQGEHGDRASAATVRLTAAQATIRYLAAQHVLIEGREVPLFGGVFAIFGHGNVAGLGEALYAHRDRLPTFRAHNEQAMAHAAIAYAKASFRRRVMACTTSIGPGATNLVTAAALAHVNRLPVLFLPGDVFASRAPDPVLQQVEDFGNATVSANDCLQPVSRYFDRIMRPEQLLGALPRAMHFLTDAALCGPVTLAFPQDVQTMAYDWPAQFLAPATLVPRRCVPDPDELARVAERLRKAKRPLIVAGGGVLYANAAGALRSFAERHAIPVAETQAGKGALPWDHPLQLGAVGVTGSTAACELGGDADVVLAVGSRLQDFTTGSHAFLAQALRIHLNVSAFDALKWRATPLVADAALGLDALSRALGEWQAPESWTARARDAGAHWRREVDEITGVREVALPYEGEVIGAVQRSARDSAHRSAHESVRDSARDSGHDPAHDSIGNSAQHDIVVCAAGSLPGELHKLWRAAVPGAYHVEYGYSCMGYEIAGGIGVKLARPEREVVVLVGDGSYLMLNSEIATSIMLGTKLVIVVLDNRGFGCINRLQQACGGAPFNNLLADCGVGEDGRRHEAPRIDFAAHAAALGATAENVATIAELEAALARARASDRTYVIAIPTDPRRATDAGGVWWDVAVPEVSERAEVHAAREAYETQRREQKP